MNPSYKHSIFLGFLLTAATGSTLLAQFPAPGGFGGQSSGNRPERQQTIPGTASDNTPKGNGKISGVLTDSTTSKPVEFATVALLNNQTGKPIDGTTSDEKGRFTINRIAEGIYRLQFSFLGYQNKESRTILIERGTDINLGSVSLSPDVRMLKEVNVVGQTAMVEEKVDRLVYNAEKDITNKGGDASDVMRKVPMLTVDLDGNVSLRGSQNVRVLINNKPSTIVASSVADALKQIPADMIKSVEVITSPSAKYDAEGSAGIINIVTKKNTLQGATLNVDLGAGNRGANLALNGSYRTGKMGFTLGGFGRTNYNVKGAFSNTQTTYGQNGTTTTYQNASTFSNGMFGHYQLGWDYDISKNSSLAASLRYGMRNNISTQDNLLTRTYFGINPPVLNARDVRTKDLSGTMDANLTYTHTYKPQQELSFLALYSRNNRTNNFTADLLNGTDMHTVLARQRNDNLSYNQESTIQADYQTPIKNNQLLEFGAKGIFRKVNSDYKYYFADGSDAPYELDDTRPANILNYNQNVTGGYASYTYTTKSKFTFKVGSRYEYTFIDASFSREQSSELARIPNYGNLVPSVNISKGLKGGRTVKVAYNRRIQRPGIQFLNPNINAANPLNISVGNPYLSPELTDNFELGLSGAVKAFYVNASLFARRTNNSITSVRDTLSQSSSDPVNPVMQRVIRTSYQNIGYEDAYGLNVFTNVTLFSKWQLGGGFDLYHTFLTNNNADPIYRATNSGWVLSGRLFTSVTLKNGWGIQGFGGARGRQVQLQGSQGTFAFYNLGIKKDFKDKRGSIGLAAENFLNSPFKVRSELSSPILSQSSVTSFYNSGVRLNFSYRLGKMSFENQSSRRRKSINNDDVKGGDDDNGGGQQQQPQGGNSGGRGRPQR